MGSLRGVEPGEVLFAAGDEVLDAMPTGDTPGQRTSVARYDVAIRFTP